VPPSAGQVKHLRRQLALRAEEPPAAVNRPFNQAM
jgi:hypothetical protein